MKPLVIAHRGASSLAPENTLAAARLAHALGADLWEADVGMSKEGELLLLHDETLERTTDAREKYPEKAPWLAEELSLAEIQSLDAGSWFHREDPFGELGRGEARGNYRGERVPTLKAALELTRDLDWRVNLELKSPRDPGLKGLLLEKTIAACRESGLLPEQVVLSSFDLDLLRRLKELAPEYRVQAVLGLDPAHPIDWGEAWDFDELNPMAELTPPAKVAELSAAGKKVQPWTVNDPKAALDYFEAGAAGVFTDYPQRLVPLVRSRYP